MNSIQFATDQTGSVPPQAASIRIPRWLEILFLLVLPPLVYWILNLRPLRQAGYLDPYFYTGYINNLEDMLKRFDLPYYAVRFGLILPGHFFSRLLGPEAGYLAFRYVLTLIAGIPFYLFTKRTFSTSIGIISYLGLVMSPWFEGTLLWDHPDASGVPYLMAAMCLVLLSRKPSWLRDGLAGCFASLAVNSNIFTGAIFGIFCIVYAATSLFHGRDWRTPAKRAGMFTAGFVLVLACGYAYYWHIFGEPRNIFAPSITMATGLSQGGMKGYRSAGLEWLGRLFHVFFPVLASLCCLTLTAVSGRRPRFEVAVCALSGGAITAFYYTHQFLMEADTLELSYYFSYALPATFLMVACIWYLLWERYAWKAGVFLAVSSAATLLPQLLVSGGEPVFQGFTVYGWVALAVATLVMVYLSRVHWQRPEVRRGTALAAVVLLIFSMAAGFGHQYKVARPFALHDDSEIDIYRIAMQLIEATPKLKDSDANVVFWFRSRSSLINSVQSTYLWRESSLNQTSAIEAGMPHLGEYQMKVLLESHLRWVTLLGESQAEIQQGLQAITEAKFGYNLVSTRELKSGQFHLNYQLIELTNRRPWK